MSWPERVARMWDRNHLFSALLELTHRCDQACRICYNPPPRDEGLLTLEQYRALLRDLADMGTLHLVLSGGEPLLHPDFVAIGRQARELGFAVRIKTNGLRLDAAMAKLVRIEIDPFGLDVSLHGGRAATHDRQTGVVGSFERVVANLREMVACGLRVRLRMPYTRWNEAELAEGLALGESLGVPVDIDPEVSPRDDGDEAPLALAASEEGLECLAAALRTRLPAKRGVVETQATSPAASRRLCGAGCATVAIDPYGEVFPCVQWRHSAGNVQHASIRDIWACSEVLAEVRRVLEKLAEEAASRPAGTTLAYCPGLASTRGEDPAHLPAAPGPRGRFLTMLAKSTSEPDTSGS